MAEHDAHFNRTPSIEDFILLQSTVESLRQERDQLLRRLQLADSAARERLQLTEARYREALSQIDALKRAAQQIRQQLEQELGEAREQLKSTSEQLLHWQITAESMRQRAAELEALLENAHARAADLETENAVLQAELERLQALAQSTHAELEQLRTALAQAEKAYASEASRTATLRQAVEQLEREHATLRGQLEQALETARQRAHENETLTSALQQAEQRIRELERQLTSLRAELDLLRAEHDQERRCWRAESASKEAEWRQARDDLARALEEEQNRSTALERELGTLQAQLCSLQMRAQQDAEQVLRVEEELETERQERQREREVFESLARQRDAQWQERFDELRQRFDRYREESEQRLVALRAELEQAQSTGKQATTELDRLRELLQAATSTRAALEDRAARYVEEIAALRETCAEHEFQRAQAEAHATELLQQLSEVKTEITRTTALLESYREQLAEERRHSAERLASWERDRLGLQQKINELELERLHTEAEIEQACWQVRVLDAALQKATVEHHAAALAAAQARSEGARWELAYRLQSQAYDALERRHIAEADTAARDRQRLGALIRTVYAEQEESRRRHAELDAALKAKTHRQGLLEAQQHELQQQNKDLLDEAARFRQALEEAETRATALTAQLAEQEKTKVRLVEEYQNSLSERDRKVLALEHERDHLLSEIGELQNALAQAYAKSARAESSYQEEIAALRAELATWPQRAAALTEAADGAQKELHAFREALLAKEHAYEDLQAQYRSLENRASLLEARAEENRTAYEKTLAELELAREHLQALQEQSVAILQAQEVLTQENQTLKSHLKRLADEHRALAAAQQRAVQERDEAVARWQESEALRRKEQTSYLAVRQQLDAERDALRNALDAARAQQAQLQAQIALWQREKAARPGMPTADLLELEHERTELKAQVEKLSAVIRQLGQEREEQRVAALQAQTALTARIDELSAERGALTLRVAELETLVSQLDRECERLRKERLSPEELRKYKAEVNRLEARVEELERLRAEAAQNHSAVVAGYLLELNQRTDALQAKEAELQKLQRELQELEANVEELHGRLQGEREERAQLEAALDELRRAAASGKPRPTLALQDAAVVTASSKPALEEPSPTPTVGAAENAFPAAQPMAGSQTTLAQVAKTPGFTVVHLEENKECREGVQRLLRQLPQARYLNTLDLAAPAKEGPLLLAVNLLNRAHDPIAALARVVSHTGAWTVFAYCADGKFGFLFGEATFFPSPFDVHACATWLLSTYGSVQRLLVASNNIEMTSELRTALAKIRCSASVALDYRQVVELVPLVQPEVVLVDLSLPRADGLKLVSRLRNDEKTAALPLGIILPDHQRVAEFRKNAFRAAREGSFSVDKLVKSLAQDLGLPEPRGENATQTLSTRSH